MFLQRKLCFLILALFIPVMFIASSKNHQKGLPVYNIINVDGKSYAQITIKKAEAILSLGVGCVAGFINWATLKGKYSVFSKARNDVFNLVKQNKLHNIDQLKPNLSKMIEYSVFRRSPLFKATVFVTPTLGTYQFLTNTEIQNRVLGLFGYKIAQQECKVLEQKPENILFDLKKTKTVDTDNVNVLNHCEDTSANNEK